MEDRSIVRPLGSVVMIDAGSSGDRDESISLAGGNVLPRAKGIMP